MAVHSFKQIQCIPVSLTLVWDFFSDPANLSLITPPDMDFRVISRYHGDRIYAGQLIEYTLRPLFRIPLYWMTEITHVRYPVVGDGGCYFVDEQRRGPYRLWHHQHHFKEIAGGVEMTDIVHYQLPFSWIGEGAHALFVRRRVEAIFRYRTLRVEERFGKLPTSTAER